MRGVVEASFWSSCGNAGIAAVGVDRDEAMVGGAGGGGSMWFMVTCWSSWAAGPEESLGGIFAGHLVEHLEREEIVELVRLAFSRLRPTGVLLLEAVNPLCLLTYAGFYGDFTRVAPVPPLALQWLAESCGFVSVGVEYACPVPEERKLRPLPESAGEGAEVEAFNRGVAAANELLFGFQEYALIGSQAGLSGRMWILVASAFRPSWEPEQEDLGRAARDRATRSRARSGVDPDPVRPRSGCAVGSAVRVPDDECQRRWRAAGGDRHPLPSVAPSAQGPVADRALSMA